ncbi:unnamed protein product [Urochloa humidicola]
MHTRLFKHLPGAKTPLNQSGMVFPGSASKMKRKAEEQLGESCMACIGDAKATLNQNQQGSSSKIKDKAEKQHDGEFSATDGDAMALD